MFNIHALVFFLQFLSRHVYVYQLIIITLTAIWTKQNPDKEAANAVLTVDHVFWIEFQWDSYNILNRFITRVGFIVNQSYRTKA